ncbi:BlaI family transcriptional regulator [Lysobacter helvus]|uniref:BlaI family transcriptional regulator n=2 Tax=Lysobacteraceae TaxID=32033 RepID=A0ABM7Q6Z0_9GAMM|nr:MULTISPECIES: BlaI/MecI/CopY family transcriptional regulator [Lysobacter]BCT93177.1 BlaI family transcriptional regulator [Lysobacter caseinilyticus]BCT96329.1 BlaI family transcriptional regulator [Lysobacter helvus]
MQITAAETEIMRVLWTCHPLSADEVHAALTDSTEWEETTVKTLLGRLLNKGAISADRNGRRYLYSPRLRKDTWLSQECTRLVDRLFGGRIAPLVAHFSSSQPLGEEDIAALRQLLDGMGDDDR